MIDLYCERIGPGLWAEPLNTLSNLAYFVAAWAVWRAARASARPAGSLLAGLLVAIGCGSGLFHVVAAPWARVLDEAPILLFQLAFLWLYCTRIVRWSRSATAAFLAGFAIAVYAGRQFPQVLNGSLFYAPAFLVAAGLATYHYRTQSRARSGLPIAVGVFVVAVILRTMDNVVCESFTIGTHFIWHLLTGMALYLFAWGLIANLTSQGSWPRVAVS